MIKKITLVAAIVLFTIGANAQFKFKGIGIGGALGTKSAISTSGGDAMGFGINALALAGITEKIDIEAGLDYFFPSSVDLGGGAKVTVNMMTINVNGRYNFIEGKAVVYGLAGLNYAMASAELTGAGPLNNKASDSKVGLNLGVGGDYKLSDKIGAYGQVGYTASSTDQVFAHVGVIYFF